MDKSTFYELVERYLEGTATAEERRIVESWYSQLTQGSIELSEQEQQRLDTVVLQAVLAKTVPQPQGKRIPFHPNRWKRYAIAGVLLLLIAGGWFMLKSSGRIKDVASLSQTQRFKNDIAPAYQGVVLQLNNGKKIRLDSLHNGSLVLDDVIKVQKDNSALAYTPNATQIRFHTISTGKGNSYHLTLPDGTEVWLDAQSSLYFPTAFTGQERTVTITGQAYFEVAKDPSKPFHVKFRDQEVVVLGTHFNINAFENRARTTLLEGSVRIIKDRAQPITLTPGQQVSISTENGQWMVIPNADIDEVMAWKNGTFRFTGASIQEIMSQLERWYNIKVEYADSIDNIALVARLGRNENISRILNLLEMTKQLEFAIDGNKVIVMKIKPPG